jgi:outer membrane immunogenic protein
VAAEAWLLPYIMDLRARFTFHDRSTSLRSETILLLNKEIVMRLCALALGIAAGIVLAPSAMMAADLGGGPPGRSIKDAPVNDQPRPSLPLYSWSGLYIGVHAGHGWSDVDWTAGGTTASDTGAGWLGGGQVGYNWQRGALVFGVEADISGSGIEGATPCPTAAADCGHDVNWLASVRGRLGIAGNGNRTLFYATAGAAWADVDYTATGAPGFSDRHFGWVAGGGIEHMLTSQLSARIEYLYYDFDGVTAPAGTLAGGAVDLDPSMHTVRAGFSFKF